VATELSSGAGGAAATAGASGAAEPSDNLFLAGLPKDITDDRVREIMSQYGVVKQCKLLPDNNKPDRAALVRMADVAQALWIVGNLSGNIPIGLTGPITARFAENKAQRARELGAASAAAIAPAAGYGKALAPEGLLPSNRFLPYETVAPASGLGSMATVGALQGAAAALGAPAASAEASANSSAALMAALMQLGQGGQGQGTALLGGGMPDISGLLGMGAVDMSALLGTSMAGMSNFAG